MKAIIVNTSNSHLNKIMEAVSLKAGFLLCDEVYAAGSTGFELFLRETCSRFSMERKLKLVESWSKNDLETMDMVREAKELLKLAGKSKHKQTEEIVFLKKMEACISDLLNIKIDEFEESIDNAGFEAIRDLKREAKFQAYHFNDDPEVPLAGITASNLLQRLLPNLAEDEEPEIFFLSNEFFITPDGRLPFCSFASPGASDVSQMVLHHSFTFPNINNLTASELQMIRSDLHQNGSSYTNAVNEWIDMCYFDDSIGDRIRYFTSQVLPAAESLQKTIEKNEILKLCGKLQNNAVNINLWLGEIPVWKLWSHYKDFKVIGDPTWKKLEALREAEAYKTQRWPVVIASLPEEILFSTQDNSAIETEIQHVKKYIAID